MGKEKPGIGPDRLVLKFPSKHQNGNDNEKGASGELVGRSSPNRDHFYSKRFAKSPTGFKSSEQLGKSKVNGAEMANETFNYLRKVASNIYIETKKHRFEMLNNGDENADPRKYGDDIFITAKMRLSPRGMANNMNGLVQENHENHPSSSGPNLESHLPIAGDNANGSQVLCRRRRT
ncbi:unnamed protein product [Fraxinus pennsylvanica]|uniref:Uncharacterized protein n=1 Tax=Fraxinus pennsylvanica TaxID=56036 RepID=A0AAD1YXF0_9LAMI|nr:unnamed protein product [Fraxinus pennsylvanica]